MNSTGKCLQANTWPWVQVPVTSEELKTLYRLTQWGENVEQPTKERACSEKRDSVPGRPGDSESCHIANFFRSCTTAQKFILWDVDRYSGSQLGAK